MIEAVQSTVIGNIAGVGALTRCALLHSVRDLKVMQRSLIRELTHYAL